MQNVHTVDDLVKEYLIFRGFYNTSRVFDTERKNDKFKGFQAEKLVDQLFLHISSHDLIGLNDFWRYLDLMFFSRLDTRFYTTVSRLESSLKKCFLVHCVQTSRADKLTEFFEALGESLSRDPEWQPWFALPYVKEPATHADFEPFFSKQWLETLTLSLSNFLGTVMHSLPPPKLLTMDLDRREAAALSVRTVELQREVDRLRRELQSERERAAHAMLRATATAERQQHHNHNHNQTSVTRSRASTSVSVLENHYAAVSNAIEHSSSLLLSRSTLSSSGSGIGGTHPHSRSHSPHMHAKPSDESSVEQNGDDSGGANAHQNRGRSSSLELTPTATISTTVSTSEEGGEGAAATTGDRPRATSAFAALESRGSDGNNVASTPARKGLTPTVGGGGGSLEHFQLPSGDGRKKSVVVEYGAEQRKILIERQELSNPHSDSVITCKFSPEGSRVATSARDKSVKIWEPDVTGGGHRCTATWDLPENVISLAWSPRTENILLCGTMNRRIRLYNTDTGKALADVLGDVSFPRVEAIVCSPTQPVFVAASTGNDSGMLSSWNMKALRAEQIFDVPKSVSIHTMQSNHNGNMLVTGGSDGMVRVYDFKSEHPILGWSAHTGDVVATMFSRDETSIFSVGIDGKVAQWSMQKAGKLIASFDLPPNDSSPPVPPLLPNSAARTFDFCMSSDCTMFFTTPPPALYDVTSGEFSDFPWDPSHGQPVCCDWHPSGNSLFIGSSDGSLHSSTVDAVAP